MKRRSLLTAAALSALPLARPALAQGSGNPRVLRFVPHADLANPDPVWSTTTVAAMHGMMVWDKLYDLDESFLPQKQMVAGEEVSDDGLTWTLTLREGLMYHDGEPVRAADAVASIERTKRRAPLVETLMAATNELVALDDHRLRLRLKKRFSLLPYALTGVFIMPERIAKTDAFTQIKEYIGSGPYRFVREEWTAGAGAVYVRNEKYIPRAEPISMWAGGKVTHFDRVEWTTMPDPSTSLAALQRGEIDWLDSVLPDHLPILRRAKDVKIEVFDQLGNLMSLFFNSYQAPFDNVKLRRAVLAAVSQQDFVDGVLGDEAKSLGGTGVGVFPPKSPYASKAGMELMQANLAAAKKMVAESGYKGEKIVLMSPTDIAAIRQSSLLADGLLKSLGLNVEFASMDWGTMIQRRNNKEGTDKGGWSCYTTSWTGLSINTPATSLPLRANGAAAGAWWRPTLPEVEKLRDAWFDAPDLATQKKIAEQIQRQALENVMFVPLGLQFGPTAFRSNLTGFARSGYAVFWGVRKTA
ncbi:MAG: ABC transporter substrate-binding protein [Acetobacteraceae bacterium]|nr:ABC transporter substrate-binding protein [Acetobacteraceae bacterium]